MCKKKKAEKKTFVIFGPAIERRRGKFGERTILPFARNFCPFVNVSSFFISKTLTSTLKWFVRMLTKKK